MQLFIIAHNIRSTHNVGSLFRTCEGFGVEKLYLTGYTPYPQQEHDDRLPHLAKKLEEQIHKTALGAEKKLPFDYCENPSEIIDRLRAEGNAIIGLEQTPEAILLPDFTPPSRVALVLGEEVRGIPAEMQKLCDKCIEIPMRGTKESFNVSVAAGIAIYGLLHTKPI